MAAVGWRRFLAQKSIFIIYENCKAGYAPIPKVRTIMLLASSFTPLINSNPHLTNAICEYNHTNVERRTKIL